MNTVYKLSESDFNNLISQLKGVHRASKIAQRDFEMLVIKENWLFSDSYSYSKSLEKVDLICDKGHTCQISPSRFKVGTRFRKCDGQCPEEAKKDLEKLIIDEGWSFDTSYQYQSNHKKVELICPNNHKHSLTPAAFKNGNRCPLCSSYGFNPNKPAYFYIQELMLDDKVYSYKFGITNRNPKDRMSAQKSKSKFTHTIIKEIYSVNGRDIRDLENIIKENITTRFVDKDYLPDGFSETINPSDYSFLISFLPQS